MGCRSQSRGCGVNIVKVVKKAQPTGPWWFRVVDGNRVVAVTVLTDLSKDFRKWCVDCHAADLQIDLIPEKHARDLLLKGGVK